MKWIRTAVGRLLRAAGWKPAPVPDIIYWERRAREYGRRSVLNIAHPESEFEMVTNYQKSVLFPLLTSLLTGKERIALDFGCGPGRFTPDLAALIGQCIGVDPIQSLLDLAPSGKGVSYQAITEGVIPHEDNSTDVVWCCLVLGGIKEETLKRTVREICRVLRPDGLLFLVENTHKTTDGEHWRFRSSDEYRVMFQGGDVSLRVVGAYWDDGQQISVMAGRKAAETLPQSL